jgi:hypothetical protein
MWQPIETAPKGTELLLYFPAGKRWTQPEMFKVDLYPVRYPRQPSHWMPLPKPPGTP